MKRSWTILIGMALMLSVAADHTVWVLYRQALGGDATVARARMYWFIRTTMCLKPFGLGLEKVLIET